MTRAHEQSAGSSTPTDVYRPDSIGLMVPGEEPVPQSVPPGTDVEGVYFDGYPQIVKQPEAEPDHPVARDKDLMVPMRDGTQLAVDVYRPDAAGQQFPAILAFGLWGKDAQEAIEWTADKSQRYLDSPLWDGTMEAGNFMYTVPRGFAHVIPDPRGIGNSEGPATRPDFVHDPADIHDVVEWIAAQPWCNGKVGMMGPSSYSWAQGAVAQEETPPHLVALHPEEMIYAASDHFHGIFDAMGYNIEFGGHGNDSTLAMPNRPLPPVPPQLMQQLPEDVLNAQIAEALENPDYKYNTKWYSMLRYPMKSSKTFDMLLDALHPMQVESRAHEMNLPMYLGTPWENRLYIWDAFHVYEEASTPAEQKKMMIYPPGFPPRPHNNYNDENSRWYDYWLKGIDNGIMDEPPIKMFVMGVNKWKFENEWPLARTEWTKFYLRPNGGLSKNGAGGEEARGESAIDRFTQPAPYLDPTVYCLQYRTAPLDEDMEITGPVACHLDAAIDLDDTNWMVDLVDVAPDGTRQLLSTTANVFKTGHAVELIIRNQDDLRSRLGSFGVYMLPFMRTVTHTIHLGDAHVLLPLVPQRNQQATAPATTADA